MSGEHRGGGSQGTQRFVAVRALTSCRCGGDNGGLLDLGHGAQYGQGRIGLCRHRTAHQLARRRHSAELSEAGLLVAVYAEGLQSGPGPQRGDRGRRCVRRALKDPGRWEDALEAVKAVDRQRGYAP